MKAILWCIEKVVSEVFFDENNPIDVFVILQEMSLDVILKPIGCTPILRI